MVNYKDSVCFVKPQGHSLRDHWAKAKHGAGLNLLLSPAPPINISLKSRPRATTRLSAARHAFGHWGFFPRHTLEIPLSFLLGGIFFSKIFPRILAAVLAILRRGSKTDRRKKSYKRSDSLHRLASRRRSSLVDFTSVKRRELVVLQHVAEQLAGRSFQTQLRRALDEGLEQASRNPNIRAMKVVTFATNPSPNSKPVLRRGRIYNTNLEEATESKSMAFDIDVEWDDCLETELLVTTKRLGLEVPICIENCSFRGSVRVILVPLIDDPPGFGACLVSFPRLPDVDFEVSVAGAHISKVPWLKQELIEALRELLSKEMVWPNRNVNAMRFESTQKNATKISADALEQLEQSDPLLETENQIISRNRRGRQTRSSDGGTRKAVSIWNKTLEKVTRHLRRRSMMIGTTDVEENSTFIEPTFDDSIGSFSESHSSDGQGSETSENGPLLRLAAWERLLDSIIAPFESSRHSSNVIKDRIEEASNELEKLSSQNFTELMADLSSADSFGDFVSTFENGGFKDKEPRDSSSKT